MLGFVGAPDLLVMSPSRCVTQPVCQISAPGHRPGRSPARPPAQTLLPLPNRGLRLQPAELPGELSAV